MKIGIYGGTFNPPHLGHITAARAAVALLELDRLLLIPAKLPPHKDLPQGSATAEQRLEMTRLAGEQTGLGPRVEVLDLELRREGKSFTSDTLEQLCQQFPGDELWLLMGADMFLSFQTWHEPGRVLELAGIAAFGRTEEDTEDLFAVQREYLQQRWPQAKIFTLTLPQIVNVSSTELRQQLGRGEEVRTLAPVVYGYILREGLYGSNVDLRHLPLPQLRAVALSYLKHKRIPHVLGTEQEAIRLARHYGLDEGKAQVAALLHDCTKKLEQEEQLALCQAYGVELDAVEQSALKLMHAKTGAALAREVFGVDEEVESAIRWHTTGRAGMRPLEKLLYLADYIEPTRDFPGVEELRRASYESLDAGMGMGLSMTMAEMKEKGSPIHENSYQAWMEQKGQSELG